MERPENPQVLSSASPLATATDACAPQPSSPQTRTKRRRRRFDPLRLCQYKGMLLIRHWRSLRRWLSQFLYNLGLLMRAIYGRAVRSLRVFAVRNNINYDAFFDILASLRRGSRQARQKGIGAWLLYWVTAFVAMLLRLVIRLFGSINYLAPLLAAVVFVLVIQGTLNLTFALRVVYNGTEIGYIADESVFENAQRQMLGRVVFEDYIQPENSVPQFTIAAVREQELLSENSLTDALILSSGNELATATGLYVDDEFIGAVSERQQLSNLLESIKDNFRSDDADSAIESVQFVKDVEMRDGLYPVSSVITMARMTAAVQKEEQQQRIYITQAGDAPISIAQKNGISYAQLKALNPDIEKSLLIGQEVLVQKSTPLLEVKVIREETVETETRFKIEQIQDPSRFQGYVKITQYGQKGISMVTSEVTYIDGIEVDRVLLDTRVVKEPINEKVIVGGKQPLSKLPAGTYDTSANFIWPVAGGYVSCGINGYWGHTGMDIAAGTGTAVYASASGTVTKAVHNSTGYGYHIIINHGGGVETLYGHNSKLHVKVGQWVEQGQLISSIGSTGRASGPHCHFEIRINGKYMDPAKYIGTTNPY